MHSLTWLPTYFSANYLIYLKIIAAISSAVNVISFLGISKAKELFKYKKLFNLLKLNWTYNSHNFILLNLLNFNL